MRSLNLSPQGLSKAREALTNQGWTYEVLAEKVEPPGKYKGISPQTVKSFFARNKVDRSYFVGICKSLELDWQDVAELPQEKLLHQVIEFSVYDNDWVGRQTFINNLSDKLRGSCRILLLVGITGIGKTALAERLVEELRGDWTEDRKNFENGNEPSATSDFASVAAEWLRKWGETLNEEERKPNKLLQRLVKRLCENRYLLLMDSLEYLLTENEKNRWGDFADEWWEKFFENILSAESCQSRLIVTSQDLPVKLKNIASRYPNFWHRQILYGLEESEQLALFEKVGLDVNAESPDRQLLMRIGKAYKGHPLVLRVIIGEIVNDPFSKSVQTYWNDEREKTREKIEEVEKALAEARQGKILGEKDEWELHKLTREVQEQVNERRLEAAFDRLEKQVNDAYILLCAASVYRAPEKEEYWLKHLVQWLKRLEKQECTKDRQFRALEELSNRYLVEESFNYNNKRLLGQHNLVRSVAIEHRNKLLQSL